MPCRFKDSLSRLFGIVVATRLVVCFTNQEFSVNKSSNIKPSTVVLVVVALILSSFGFGNYQSNKGLQDKLTNLNDSLVVLKKELHRVRKNKDYLPKTMTEVTFTSYNPVVEQTNEEPFITASGDSVDYWTLALSRDMITRYNPDADFSYRDTVYAIIPLVLRDTMNKRYEKSADILSFSMEVSKLFGRKKGYIAKL